MKIHIKIFPVAGLSDRNQEFELALQKGSFNEALALLQKLLDVNLSEIKTLMFLHNGHKLENDKDEIFQEGDQLWLLPLLSGG